MDIYVDANVFISIIFQDFGKNLEFMDLRSIEFLDDSLKCKYNLLVSDLVVEEFCEVTKLSESDFYSLFLKNPKKLRVVYVTERNMRLSKTLINNKLVGGRKDAVHASVAIDNNSAVICTWNKRDFLNLETKFPIIIRTPSEL